MPPQARLGDKALIPADAHGCVACPHTASGPAVAGSPNVNVNGRPAFRVDDPGIHTACCGGNTWNAQTGSKSVFINGKPAHRLGDMVRHCGGVGKTIEGSPNVIVGDRFGGSVNNQPVQEYSAQFRALDAVTGKAIPNAAYLLELSNGTLHRGRTDAHGLTMRIRTESQMAVHFYHEHDEMESSEDAPEDVENC